MIMKPQTPRRSNYFTLYSIVYRFCEMCLWRMWRIFYILASLLLHCYNVLSFPLRWVAMGCSAAVVEGCLRLEGCTSLACIQWTPHRGYVLKCLTSSSLLRSVVSSFSCYSMIWLILHKEHLRILPAFMYTSTNYSCFHYVDEECMLGKIHRTHKTYLHWTCIDSVWGIVYLSYLKLCWSY